MDQLGGWAVIPIERLTPRADLFFKQRRDVVAAQTLQSRDLRSEEVGDNGLESDIVLELFGQKALDAGRCLTSAVQILDQAEADVAFAHGSETDARGCGHQRLFHHQLGELEGAD